MSRSGPVFVEGVDVEKKVASTPTVALGRKAKEGTELGGSGAESSTQPSPSGAVEFDVFDYLNDPESVECLRDPVLQRMTVIRYDGDVNEQGFFHGKGTLVSTLGYVYTGELDRGLMHGQGTVTWSNGITYTGGFRSNMPHGLGKYEWSNGDWYEGNVVDSVRSGRGTFFYSALEATYTGEWLNGERHGKGDLQYTAKSRYSGEWQHDKKDGRGLMIYESGDRYEGGWKQDQRHGFGVMVWTTNGNVVEVYKGNWVSGLQNGEGFSMYIRLPANIAADAFPPPTGEGALGDVVPPKDSAINTYRGGHKKGERHGFGTFIYDDGSRYEGGWMNHQKHGEGKHTTANGVVTLEHYEKGTPVVAAAPVQQKDEADALVDSLSVEAAGVPLYIRDVLGPSENNVPEAVVAVQSVLLRHNGLLRRIFNAYCTMADGVAVLSTPPSWRRDRTQGSMAVIQLLRCLSDARLINGGVTVAEVGRILANMSDRHGPSASSESAVTPSIALQARLEKPWAEYRKQLHVFVGEITFRDFTEAIVRIADAVYQDDLYGTLAQRVLIVIEDHLSPVIVPPAPAFPLCSSTRANKEHVVPHIKLLQDLFVFYSKHTSLGHANAPALPESASKKPSSSTAAAASAVLSVAGITIRVRQFLLMLKEGGCFSDDRFTIGKALKVLFPYDKHSAFTAMVHKKRLLPAVHIPLALSQQGAAAPLVPQAPRGNMSDCASSQSEAAGAVSTPVPSGGLSEAVYRCRWLMAERSRGLSKKNLHDAIQPELELTFMEFIEAIVQAALIKDTAAAPGDRIKNFISSYLVNLHSLHC